MSHLPRRPGRRWRGGLVGLLCAGAAAAALALPGSAGAQEISFRTPSGNIHCYMGSGRSVQCWVLSARCRGDGGAVYAYAWAIRDNGRASRFCPGDFVRGARVLSYGRFIRYGGTRCVSRESGLTCTRTATGRGFFLSRQGQRTF